MREKEIVKSFFRKYRMDFEDIDFTQQYRVFLEEMEEGLKGKDSSLAMIPTYIEPVDNILLNEPVIALDAGGTNLRAAIIYFNQYRQPIIKDFHKYPMPGTTGELSRDGFFQALADCVEPLINQSSRIGFCFSYPTDMMPNRDGRLIRFTKEIKAGAVAGELIGENLLKALKERGYSEKKKIVVLNDTTAALLAGQGTKGNRSYDSFLGFILGTGTNACYIENNANIEKLSDLDPRKSMIINVEWGSFNKHSRGDMDLELDQSLLDPGFYVFEKMVSGAYIGKLVLTVLKKAGEESLFSFGFQHALVKIQDLETKDVDDFLHYPPSRENPLATCLAAGNSKDSILLYWIIETILERAAILTAINLSALIKKTGKGFNPCQPVCITVEGTTFFTLKGLREKIEYYLKKFLWDQMGLYYEFVRVDHASLIGAAIAGLGDGN
ncbi:MAG: hexokinase family protein [Bacillota bacterium]|jgi:hexokinase